MVPQALFQAVPGTEGTADMDHYFPAVVNYIDSVLGSRIKGLARQGKAVQGRRQQFFV